MEKAKPDPDSRKSTANGRKKGHNFERRVAATFRNIHRDFIAAARNDETRPGALLGVDILNTPPFRIQCKCTARFVPLSTINEIPRTQTTIPLLIAHSTESKQTLVTLPYQHFLALLTTLKNNSLDITPPNLADF
jgi:hypothetical protein